MSSVHTIAQRAMLVTLNIRSWAGRRRDRTVTQEVAASKGVSSGVGNYNKALLPNCAELAAINGTAQAIRQWLYRNTLPWSTEGVRIIPTSEYMRFCTEFTQYKSEWDRVVTKFVMSYPILINRARNDLGPMFDLAEYPSTQAIEQKFSLALSFAPVPTAGDFRVNLDTAIVEQIGQEAERSVHAAMKDALVDAWSRLHDKLAAYHDKLVIPDAIFRNSTHHAVVDMCETLRRLNITNDADLNNMCDEVMQFIGVRDPDEFRTNSQSRQDAATKADELMNKMRGFMEGY